MSGFRPYGRSWAAPGVIVCAAALALAGCANHRGGAGPTGAAAPPPAASPIPASYYIFFDKRSADLLPDARGVIAGAARDAARAGANKVRVVGYTDPKGDPAANEQLARDRAQRVATALIANGVAPWAVVVVPHGEVDDMVTSQGERRVRITFE